MREVEAKDNEARYSWKEGREKKEKKQSSRVVYLEVDIQQPKGLIYREEKKKKKVISVRVY